MARYCAESDTIAVVKRVLLLLCTGVELFEAAAFYDVLGWSGSDGSEAVEVVPVGVGDQVRCTFGLRLHTDLRLADAHVEDFDALAIPGGFGEQGFYEEAYSTAVGDLICHFEASHKPIAAICVGALPVAHSGVLKGRRGTTYKLLGGHRRKELASFGVEVVDAPLVCDGRIMTSTGPSTSVDVALWLLSELTGQENADHIRYLMGF